VRYILNSAVITGAGTYTYRLITPEDARTWLADGPYTSTIGYEETQEALVIRLAPSMGGRRIDPSRKGKLTPDEVLASFELGLLFMISCSLR
jgi:hypothetical protein